MGTIYRYSIRSLSGLPADSAERLTTSVQRKQFLVLGNLRRPVEKGKVYSRHDRKGSDTLTSAMSAGHWTEAAQIAETVNTVHWIYWNGAPSPKENGWLEDVFFADRGWLEAWKMPTHGGRQPFQDIYDLVGRAGQTMSRFRMMPVVSRMPLETNRMIHLWHPRVWSTWTIEMRDYFLKRPEWRGTEFANAILWRELIELRKRSDKGRFRAVVQLRMGARGTVTRYGMELRAWLAHGGTNQLRAFYDSRKGQA